MLLIKVYMLMGECRIEAEMWYPNSPGEPGHSGTTVNWQGALDSKSPLSELTNHITNALGALDAAAGEIHEMVLFSA